MKKKMTRRLAASLCLCLLLGATACGADVELSEYKQALAAIEQEDYTTAYELLLVSKDRRAAEELEKFVFVPTKYTHKNSSGSDVVYEYTYDTLGNLLKKRTTYENGEEYVMEYTYSGYKMLTRYRQGPDTTYSYRYTYDSAGNRVQEWYLDRNGDWLGKTTFVYDEQNHCLSKEVLEKDTADDPEPKLSESKYDTYDTEGRMLSSEETYYYQGEAFEQSTSYYTYEEDGSYCVVNYADGFEEESDLITTTYYDADGKVLKGNRRTDAANDPYVTYEYRYNERGDVEYYHEYFAPNERDEVSLYEYDDQGNLLKKETTDLAGETSYIETYTYDGAGNYLTHEWADLDVNSWQKEEYTYDAEGHLLTQKVDYNGGWSTTTCTYDEQGNKVKEEQESEFGSYTRKYEYDQWGNATRYFQYRIETIGETAVEKTAQWQLRYYPKGVPDEVQSAIDNAYME